MLKALLSMQQTLLDWFDRHRRVMPWRALKGQRPDPYHVWLSEVMLQQTTVVTVGPYFQKFIKKWPRLSDLAAASLDDVLVAWAGLGYYARARNLHKCAKMVIEKHGGVFPDTEEGLQELPGIGPYTAGAIAAIAFDRPAIAVDGNVERVVSRLFKIETPLPASKTEIRARTADISRDNPRPGDFVQALMELGSTVCTPAKPKCGVCPWQKECRAFKAGMAEILPRRSPKEARPQRYGTVFWLEDAKGRVFLRKRPEKGLLGGMTEVPSTEWQEKQTKMPAIIRQAPVAKIQWQPFAGKVRHVFSHFSLELTILRGRQRGTGKPIQGGFWVQGKDMEEQALPSVMRKVVRLVLGGRA